MRLPRIDAPPTDRLSDLNPRMLRRLEAKAHGGLATGRPGSQAELVNLERAKESLRRMRPEQRIIAVDVAEAAERLGVQGDGALRHAAMFGGRDGIARAELLAHTLLNKRSARTVTFAEFAAESGLNERAARDVLLRVAAESDVKLPPDLSIRGLD